ncbi:MAG TPA: argininosuccinate synthase, partial [Planctomycetota bacterium]|nr:argininosuccinate synthase [Planctomycetota bacterium]
MTSSPHSPFPKNSLLKNPLLKNPLVVLAYSGGLDTSWCIPRLRAQADARVVTVTVDVGGMSAGERSEMAARSRSLGAIEHVHLDARATFFQEIVRFLIFGNVLRGAAYPFSVGAERSLQAREVARIAREMGAGAIAHGCTAAGNDQVRFEVALRTVAPEMAVLAPVRDEAPSREQEVAYLESLGFPVPASTGSYSINSGLWGVTIGGRETLQTHTTLPEAAWVRTRGAFDKGLQSERHVLSFERGIPCAWDGEALDPVALIERIDAQAAAMGIGRGIHLGETILGVKGRVAFEAPAATVILHAHRELEKLVLTGRQTLTKDLVARTYGDLVHEGQFLEPTCRDIEALLEHSQARVTGEVQLLFRTGSLFVEGVESPFSLRSASRALY